LQQKLLKKSKKMKIKEKEQLKNLNIDQLEAELAKKYTSLRESKLKLDLGQLRDTSIIRQLQDEIAVIKTFLNEKRLLEQLKPGRANG